MNRRKEKKRRLRRCKCLVSCEAGGFTPAIYVAKPHHKHPVKGVVLGDKFVKWGT